MRIWRCQRGAAAVEFAIVGSLLILFSVGAFEIGRALFIRHHMTGIADDAARAILIDETVSDATLTAAARGAFLADESATLQVSLTQEVHSGITYRVLTLSYPATLLIPKITTTEITVSVTRRVPVG